MRSEWIAGGVLLTVAVGIGCQARPQQGADAARGGPVVKGLFALNDPGHPVAAAVYANADVAGVSLRAGWKDLQPREDDFAWEFDEEIARARKAGKQLMLVVAPGEATPAWVYDAGAAPFRFEDDNPYRRTQGQALLIPVPWDPVFLQKWTAFVRAFGKHYAGNDAVVLVHMVGPVRAGGEMHLPKSKRDREHWAKIGYTPDKLVDAWKAVIDAYATAFPTQALALDIAIPIADDGAMDRIVAYAADKLGPRLRLQHNALSAKTLETWKPHRVLKSYQDKVPVGFQMLCPVTPRGRFNDEGRRFGGTLADAFRLGRQAGASYYEIYPVDLGNEAAAAVLHEVAGQLRK